MDVQETVRSARTGQMLESFRGEPSTLALVGHGILISVLPREHEKQTHANANCAVRHVERGKTCDLPVTAFDVKVNEIYDVPYSESVNEVADNAAKN